MMEVRNTRLLNSPSFNYAVAWTFSDAVSQGIPSRCGEARN